MSKGEVISIQLIFVLLFQLLEMLKSYAEFEIDDITGEALTIHKRLDIHYNRVLALQVSGCSIQLLY